MDKRKTTVLGVYSSAVAAERAVDALMQAGFSNQAMSVLLPNQSVTTGSVAGGTLALVAMGIPEHDAKRYEGHLKEGGVLLSVACEATGVTQVKSVLAGTGADNVDSTGEASVESGDLTLPVAR